MTLEANVLRADSLKATDDGYAVDVHLAWYRSLPLSCVENISISIGGQAIDNELLRIQYQGNEYSLPELADKVDDWWFIQDALSVTFPATGSATNLPKSNELTTLEVELATRIPYIIIGPDMALVQRTKADMEVTVQ